MIGELMMRKTIIAVRGQPDSGKTTAITLAYEELAKTARIIYSNPRYDATELKEVFEIDGMILGFASSGDKPDRLERTLRFLLKYDCVVIVCAARLNRCAEPVHKTIKAVEQFSEENEFTLEWIDEARDWNHRNSQNNQLAAKIVAKVKKAINALAFAESAT
jgi:KaiC/GvpD/RAD55 family RecA-like ATPase